ncbi:MAG TPA: Rid family hydrolase [Terriglobales bacterium]|jgi:reactive intermediate/imine deaminase|nr:Rid family hydrolase [Terriglobales bacterium]
MKLRTVSLALLLLLSITAVAADSDRKHIVLRKSAPANTLPFSEGVLVGNTLYLGGHIGLDPKTGKPGATPEDEARLVMDGIKQTVETAGMTMDDLVSVQVFCSDVANYDAFNAVYRTYFHGEYPARAFLGSGKLLFGARYEVMGIAVKGTK